MQIFSAWRIHVVDRVSVPATKAAGSSASETIADAALTPQLRSRIANLRDELQDLQATIAETRPARNNWQPLAAVTSADSLGLSTASTPTQLQSSRSLTWYGTSFSPTNPQFSGSSTSTPTLSGTYNGTTDGTRTFKVKTGGTVGITSYRIQEFDERNQLLDDQTISQPTPAETPITFADGLVLQFSLGTLAKNDSFSVSVYGHVANNIDPDNPFNGTGAASPNFAPETSVSVGTFQVNGVTMTVDAGDTVNSILSKITNSAAGVTATFDAVTQQATLTSKVSGSQGQIVLSDDTSGFLAALHLNDAVSVPGEDADIDKSLSNVSALSTITSGEFSVNQKAVAVDTDADSLNAILDRISAARAGVTATCDSPSNRVTITPDSELATLSLDDAGTDFFQTLGISTGTLSAVSQHIAARPAPQLVQRLENFAANFNRLVNDLQTHGNKEAANSLLNITANVLGAGTATATSGTRSPSQRGLTLNTANGSFKYLSISANEIHSAARANPKTFAAFFNGNQHGTDPGGVLTAIDVALASIAEGSSAGVSENPASVSFLA